MVFSPKDVFDGTNEGLLVTLILRAVVD